MFVLRIQTLLVQLTGQGWAPASDGTTAEASVGQSDSQILE